MLEKISSKNSIDDVISTLIDYYNKAKFEEIIRQESELTYLYPDSISLLNIFGSANLALKQNKKAIKNFKKAITLNPNSPEVFYNLGLSFHNDGNFKSALLNYRKAIKLKPNYAEAHCNLGMSFSELGDFEEALVSYQKAIEIDPKYAGAYYNLGNIYREKENWSLAIDNYNRAIDIKPDYAEAHCNLGKVLYAFGDKNSALRSIERANVLDPDSKYISLLLSVLKARKARVNNEASKGNITTSDCITKSPSKILLLNRLVEPELISYLYRTKLLDLDKERDPSFGSTRGSLYDLFETKHPIIKKLAVELKSILVKVFKSDIFIIDSFFSIFGAGGGTIRHTHLTKEDRDSTFDLGKQKYSLVYYLSTGDQECLEPGFLKFYEPSEKILPKKGMITIFPANRQHSSVYGGKEDRVIVGANFYKL